MGTQPTTRSAPPTPSPFANPSDIVDVLPAIGPDGGEVFATEDMILANGHLMTERTGLAVVDGPGAAVDPAPETTTFPTSVVPTGRMAGSSWAEIADALRRNEQGDHRQDVVVNPGGSMDVTVGGTARSTSRLPQGRMAAKPYIRVSDLDEVRQCDPENVENWTPLFTNVLDGWQFTLQPLPGGQRFTFVAFRSPNDAGHWRIWVQHPDMDDRLGHRSHMIVTSVEGYTIPVICSNPGAAPTPTLAEARVHAAKWATYTQRVLLGQDPEFSK